MHEVEEFKNGYLRLFRSGVANVTSTQETTIEGWLNNTFYLPATILLLLYYNGTHSDQYNASKSYDVDGDFFNFLDWWTGYDTFSAQSILKNDTTDTRSLVIPPQNADSEILVQVCIRQWNVSSQSYINSQINGTFRVLFSFEEVTFFRTVQTTTAIYIMIVWTGLINSSDFATATSY